MKWDGWIEARQLTVDVNAGHRRHWIIFAFNIVIINVAMGAK